MNLFVNPRVEIRGLNNHTDQRVGHEGSVYISQGEVRGIGFRLASSINQHKKEKSVRGVLGQRSGSTEVNRREG